MSWNPELYLKYGQERTQPAIDLAARVDVDAPGRVIDLGCGPGNSTAVLRERWPKAHITGFDCSNEMIVAARKAYPEIDFVVGDISDWSPDEGYDVIFLNAVLQWLPEHERLLNGFMAALNGGGALAIQVPHHYYRSPVHQAIQDISNDSRWSGRMERARNVFTHELPSAYYNILSRECPSVSMWQTDYYHVMDSVQAILEWVKGTALRPFLQSLTSDEEKVEFQSDLLDILEEAYPAAENGKVLYPFSRLFMVAYKD